MISFVCKRGGEENATLGSALSVETKVQSREAELFTQVCFAAFKIYQFKIFQAPDRHSPSSPFPRQIIS